MWWYLLWWLVICNGNTALAVAVVNRVHGYALPQWQIDLSHTLHYVFMLFVPLVTLISTGWYGPRLLWGGDWSELNWGWWAVFTLSAISTVMFWGRVALRHIRPAPSQQIQSRSRHVDISQELGRFPVGEGPHQWMTRLPGNQIFQLQITQRELILPRLPSAWDGVSILHFSDSHFIGTIDRAYFERVIDHAQQLACDLVCFSGDLLDDLTKLVWLPNTLGRLQAPLGRFFILGNHDWHLDMSAIRQELTRIGWHDVAAVPAQIDRAGEALYLAGSEYPWINQQPTFAAAPPTALKILLSHTPDNLSQAQQQQVDLMLSGHNHGGQIQLPLIGPVYCPSRFGCYYAEGLFYSNPTLLHVSRGLSGRHPLRYRCLPEITKLTLRVPQRRPIDE